jgi:hypothetical protein
MIRGKARPPSRLGAANLRLALVILGTAAAAYLTSCTAQKPSALVTKGSGAYIGSQSDLKPDGDPGPKAKMVMSGMIIPVDVKTKASPQEFDIDLWYQGELFEEEQYHVTPDEFQLVNSASETYSPPIPLLRFPMNVGDVWKWSGQMITGPVGRGAKATIRTQDDKVDMGAATDALMVEVDLSIESGASEPAMRRLTFWFVKGKGLVKRQFGDSTSRLPDSAAPGS